MANPFESVDRRERGTIVSWDAELGLGMIHADSGERIWLYRSSILAGSERLQVGQCVEFSRMGSGQRPNAAAVLIPVAEELTKPT